MIVTLAGQSQWLSHVHLDQRPLWCWFSALTNTWAQQIDLFTPKWLQSLVGALHWLCRGHGFKSCWRHLKFFRCKYTIITVIVKQVWGSFLKFMSQPHCANISLTHHSFDGNTWAQQIDLFKSEWLHGSVGQSTSLVLQRSWLWIPLKTPEIFYMYAEVCPARVRIIS